LDDFSATCKALAFQTGGEKCRLGLEFHFTPWARDAREYARFFTHFYCDLNGQDLAGARQLLRVR
jgi:hypothetical protein